MKIFRMCTDELQRRLPIDFKGMVVKVIKKDGIQDIEYDTSKQVLSAWADLAWYLASFFNGMKLMM